MPAVWAAALAGAVISVVSLTDGRRVRGPAPPPAPPERPGAVAAIGDRLPLSFGSASVGGVVRVTGPREIMGLPVRRGERVLQAQVTLVNVRRRPIVYPASRLRLDAASGLGAVVVATGSAEGGRIGALRAHRYAVRFALADGAPMPRLRIGDPAGRTHVVGLGAATGLETLDLGEHHQPLSGGHGR